MNAAASVGYVTAAISRDGERDNLRGPMTEQELLEICRPRLSPLRALWRYLVAPYWTADIYGFGKLIREYGRFPQFLPLCIYTDHGPGVDGPLGHEIESDAPVQFYHSTRVVEQWKRTSRKPCYVLYSPFVFYRRTMGISRAADAAGTLAYPAHTIPEIDDESDIELYIKQLQSLPEEFQPVSVNLHCHDIAKGQHRTFLKHGIPVLTAGDPLSPRFPERFYEILRRFKYSTSNFPMSCLFYSVELGIPHFLLGNLPVFNNKGNPYVSPGRQFDPLNEWPSLNKLYQLFHGISTGITQEQRELVEAELGLRDALGRADMTRVLYGALVRWVSCGAGIKHIARGIAAGQRKIRRPNP